jgi:ubiquinol-cytochrome c reductase cytochrome c1 subunit
MESRMKHHTLGLLAALFALLASTVAVTGASAQEVVFDRWPSERAHDMAALQNGARVFANYCLNCHSANLMRWNKLRDIGVDEAQIKDFLIMGNQKVGDLMTIAMDPKDAKAWLGKTPPDLSLIVRARTSFEASGTDYIYTLLRGYYRDGATPTGWNNVAYPTVAMPNIFWETQGPREATLTRVEREDVAAESGKPAKSAVVRTVSVFDADGKATVRRSELETGDPSFSFAFKAADPAGAAKVDGDVADLVAYLAWMTEPGADARVRIGVFALLFLGVFTVCAWLMNGAYWKSVK